MALPKLQTFITRERFCKTGAVIFLHGEEGCAKTLKDRIKSFYYKNWDFEHVQVIYPQAPQIPYTIDKGQLKNVWFDRKDLNPTGPEMKDSLERSCSLVRQLVNDLVTSGTKRNRIVLGGIDLGAQLAMHVGYRYLPDIAGVFGLSTYLNPASSVFRHILKEKQEDKNKEFPRLFLCHDHDDKKTSLKWATLTAECFMDLDIDSEFHVYYAKDDNELSVYEIDHLKDWILTMVPEEF
ncbi:lysophospholipase-like protein 1 [Exaiptasia diaphana]|uniref:palmitoyl-protein hydrolase n=1 Tax=Exaiptasia diaphana TaxID=2652724 RepID=A0A913XNJ7_EXADI|nr:lysophospholipase-like protein 1 [Exaiptasia diaphana]